MTRSIGNETKIVSKDKIIVKEKFAGGDAKEQLPSDHSHLAAAVTALTGIKQLLLVA